MARSYYRSTGKSSTLHGLSVEHYGSRSGIVPTIAALVLLGACVLAWVTR